MFRHAVLLNRRDPQNLSDLPASIGNPTSTLPQSIAATGVVTTDPSATAPLVTAQAPSGLTTITETETLARSISGLDTVSTTITTKTRTITDPSEYASLTSAAALSASTRVSTTSSKTSAAATSSAAAQKSSSSNTSTLIPAIVVPIVVVLLASLGVFWFLMRRRHRRELKSQPEFVMAGKGEKLSSRSNSGRSTSSAAESEKKGPVTQAKELSTKSPPMASMSEWPSTQIGLARPLTPQETKNANLGPAGRSLDQARPGPAPAERPYRNFSGPGPRPPTANRAGPQSSARELPQQRDRGYSNPNQRGPPPPRTGPSPIPRASPNLNPRGGPSPVPQRPSPSMSQQPFRNDRRGDASPASAAFRLRDPSPGMNHNTRAQAPARLAAAPPTGAYNGASSISQYSPIVKDSPGPARPPPTTKRGPPPPLKTDLASRRADRSPNSASPGALTEENMRIARLANSSRLGYTPAEPSPSPKLPPPATRSQLIPRESPKDKPENYFGGSVVGSLPQSRQVSTSYHSDRASIVSDPDEYEDIDAKSDVSSLNEFERFDFGPTAGGSRGGGSAAGHSLNYFAAQNSPSAGRGSPFGDNDTTYERW
ncbi:hypothetical protein PV08_01871 [Exophiala spinifera]|uniref:Uncharacterized protein n=1 Tax=Exophiala spinifera TaxID=91928 RepID=A0A0D1Z0X2_9EURO|nr:uncharacterized protein PV08_01871 [Exophiala spinifera]KIW21291.1 hypothetical protein PV08_01871 [Exophiala spinifera]